MRTEVSTRFSGKEIRVEESVLEYSEEMIILIDQMTIFANAHAELYRDLYHYVGAASKEFEEYGQAQYNQIAGLLTNYMLVSTALVEMVAAFCKQDKYNAEQIENYLDKVGKILFRE